MKKLKQDYRLVTLCRVIGVTTQGYYAWSKRQPSARKQQDEMISVQIRILFAQSKCRYGSPRIHDDLQEQGIRCGRKRVERLMREQNLQAKAARKYKATTDSSKTKDIALDLVQRNFTVSTPNEVWVGDITYLWTAEGWLYLAVFLDLYSRKVVGWATSKRIDSALVSMAFARAVARRKPPPGLIVHTDRGSQYGSKAFRAELKKVGARQSMGSKGDCYDNAVAESFFHTFKVEAIYGCDIVTRREMEYEVFEYIEYFYNKRRKHSAIGLCSPEQFEAGVMMNRKAIA